MVSICKTGLQNSTGPSMLFFLQSC